MRERGDNTVSMKKGKPKRREGPMLKRERERERVLVTRYYAINK